MRFALKPVFVAWLSIVAQLPVQLFTTLWGGGFLGAMTQPFLGDSAYLMWGAIVFLAVPLVAVVGKALNYARTEYRFFDDRLEFDEGFLTINKKVIKYKDVKEVTLRKGVLQRTCGLGTIYLGTLATGSATPTNFLFGLGFGNISSSGIGLRDIANPDETFERIKSLVAQYNV